MGGGEEILRLALCRAGVRKCHLAKITAHTADSNSPIAQNKARGIVLGRFAPSVSSMPGRLTESPTEVFVTEGDCDNPLGEHLLLLVDDEPGISRVRNCLVEGVEKADPLADFAQE